MNTLTCGTDSYDFTTVDELLATPLVQRYVKASHLAFGKHTLWAYDGRALCLIGRFKAPVRLPLEVRVPSSQDQ